MWARGTPQHDHASIEPDTEQTDTVPAGNPSVSHRVDAGAAGKLPGTGHAGRWFPALCALIAITAALVALAAPWVQPRLDTAARHWFGAGNIVSRLVAPEPTVAPAPSMVPQPLQALASADFAQRVEATLQSHQAIYEQRARAVSKSLDAMRDQLARAAVSESAAIDGLNRRADRLQFAAAAVEARARASNVLALAVGLRRDIDAGVAIVRDSSALQSIGGFPPPVEAALRQLGHFTAGVPTMRDLAEAFSAVRARLAAHTSSWSFSRGWTRVQAAFGVNSQSADDVRQEHLQALVAEGRYSEAANVLETSEWAPLGAEWIAMVRARAAGVTAAQVIFTYALQITETAYSATSAASFQKLPQ